MRIAIPVDEKKLEGTICPSFGRTPYYLIYENDGKSENYIENPAAQSQGGAGIQAAQLLVDEKVDIVLTPRCGKNAADVLIAAGIKLYKTSGDKTADALDQFSKGELGQLNEIHPGFHNHGGNK